MDKIYEFLERLKTMIPARTLGILLLVNALMLTLVDKPEDLAGKYQWVILTLSGLCLVFNFIGSLVIDKKSLAAAFISSGALLLLTLSQRFNGPLAAFGVDTKAVFIVIGVVAAMYGILMPIVCRDALARDPNAQTA